DADAGEGDSVGRRRRRGPSRFAPDVGSRSGRVPDRLQSPTMSGARRVIDMECSVPKREAATPTAADTAEPERPAGYGMANYERIFRSRREGGDARPTGELAAYVDVLARAGVVRAVPFGAPNDEVAELPREYPDRFIGLARISGL